MFEQLKEKLKGLSTPEPAFDPAELNDPVALNTSWEKLSNTSTNFKTHNYMEISPKQAGFTPTVQGRMFPMVFLIVGIGICGVFLYQSGLFTGEPFDQDLYFLLGFGTLFAILGGILLYKSYKPVLFDKSNGYFWKDWKTPETVYNTDELKHAAKLSDIHAIQLIRTYKQGSGRNSQSYYCYELNLVLKDASRLNVVAHGNGHALVQDAYKLSAFLDVPVWIGFKKNR